MSVVCSDCSITYLSEHDMRKQLHAVSYNLSSAVDFPTRICNKCSTAMNNVVMNTLHFSNILITPPVNGLSDEDVQLLTFNEINLANKQATLNYLGYKYKPKNKISNEIQLRIIG